MTKLITIREYAKRTGQSYATVYRKIRDKQLEPVVIEKKVMRLQWDDVPVKL